MPRGRHLPEVFDSTQINPGSSSHGAEGQCIPERTELCENQMDREERVNFLEHSSRHCRLFSPSRLAFKGLVSLQCNPFEFRWKERSRQRSQPIVLPEDVLFSMYKEKKKMRLTTYRRRARESQSLNGGRLPSQSYASSVDAHLSRLFLANSANMLPRTLQLSLCTFNEHAGVASTGLSMMMKE